jgi:hypothetical protein
LQTELGRKSDAGLLRGILAPDRETGPGMSTLERLYAYAKSTGAGARENFTTEALAGAVRTNPIPLLRLLREAALLPPDDITDLSLDTQVVLPGTGVLDIVLVAVSGGLRRELWCEVKVNAGESGTQLDAYVGHIASMQAATRPTLFTLGPHALRDDPAIPFLSWHRLRRFIDSNDGPAWHDFSDYLSEVGMSDDFDQPIAAREAAAMDDFRALHGKVARIVAEVGVEAASRWPGLPWPKGEPAIRKRLLDRLASHGQLVIGVQSVKSAWLVFGVEAASGEADLVAAVETWPSAADLQRDLHILADSASFGPEWKRSLGAWGGVKRRERLVLLGDPSAAAGWVLARIEELSAAGLLQAITVSATGGDT